MRTYGPRACTVLYPIVQFTRSHASRTGLHREELNILVHTRLTPEKNVDTVLRGFGMFVASGKCRARLHVVGDGNCRSSLQELATELRVDTAVHFHGFLPQTELNRIYELCEVFALLPIDEPFGMVFPEAASRGLLLVGPNHGGPAEILEHGDLGFVVDAFAPDELASVFERIVALSDEQAHQLRERADRACRARFAAATVGPQMVSAYGLS